MALYTLQEGINFDKEVALNTAVTYREKMKEAVKKLCQGILEGSVTTSDAAFTGKGITNNQLAEAGFRVGQGMYAENIAPLLKYNAKWPADPSTASDVTLINIAKDAIWPIAKLIGASGVI